MNLTKSLYDYQEETLFHLQNSKHKRECVTIATGGGKTFLFCTFAMNELREGRKSLIVVNRTELLSQTFDEFVENFGYMPRLIEAGYKVACEDNHGVYIAMTETLKRRPKLIQKLKQDVSNLIVDECHIGDGFSLLGDDWNRIIGFTATPQYKAKNKCLAEHYHNLYIGADIGSLLNNSFLLRPLTYAPKKLVYSNIGNSIKKSKTSNDYDIEDMTNKLMEVEIFSEVMENIRKYRKGRTIIYNAGVEHSKAVHAHLVLEGFESYHIDGSTSKEDRKEIIKKFSTSQNAIINNCNVLTFGFNQRFVETIILNRLTKSENLFIQMAGRGARTAGEIKKQNFILLDLFGNAIKHGLWEAHRDWNEKFKAIDTKDSDGDAPVKLCPICERVVALNASECEHCGHVFEKKDKEKTREKDDLVLITQTEMHEKIERIMEQVKERGQKLYAGLYQMIQFVFKNTGNKEESTIELELMIGLKAWIEQMKKEGQNKRFDQWHKDFVINEYKKLAEKELESVN
jgi:superfamily II DNA or RNA helicase